MTDDSVIRVAEADDRIPVLRLLEGALLEVDPGHVDTAIGAGNVYVAGDPVTGALVAEPTVEGAHITALAVHPNNRRSGVGTALVSAATERWGSLTATFDERAYPFYAALDFDIESCNGRWHARHS